MQHGTGYHCNGTGYIVFLYSEQITGKAGQRRHSKQQEAKAPIPAGIKKIACARKENNPLFFLPEYIPVQKKNNEKKEREPECRKQHRPMDLRKRCRFVCHLTLNIGSAIRRHQREPVCNGRRFVCLFGNRFHCPQYIDNILIIHLQ